MFLILKKCIRLVIQSLGQHLLLVTLSGDCVIKTAVCPYVSSVSTALETSRESLNISFSIRVDLVNTEHALAWSPAFLRFLSQGFCSAPSLF